MATDVKKLLDLIAGRTGVGLPESVQGLSELRGEDGRVYLRLGIGVHRDIIKEIGYESDPEIPADLAAAMAEVTLLAKDKAIMAAALITPEQISAGLSGGEGVDEENREAVGMAALMLRECLRNYSAAYNKARAERLKAMEAAPEQREG